MLVRVCAGQRWAVACICGERICLGFLRRLGVAVRSFIFIIRRLLRLLWLAVCGRGEFDRPTGKMGVVRSSRPIVILVLHGACV
jgi:hypothetical protein